MGQKTTNDEGTGSWMDTLYIWDGIVTIQTDMLPKKDGDGGGDDDDDKKEEGKGSGNGGVPISWDGTWVAEEKAADAMDAPAPKRNAFAEFVDSDVKFTVDGLATPYVATNSGAEDDAEKNDEAAAAAAKSSIPPPFVVKLVSGAGWEMEDVDAVDKTTKTRHQDDAHDVLVKSLRWSGNMYDQTENLVVARGTNKFGPFISAGWMRPGNRWTVARRYLPEDDPRADWTLHQLLERIADQTVTTNEDTGQKKVRIPCWQCPAMHSDHTKSDAAPAAEGDHESKAEKKRGEKRKADEDVEGKDGEKVLKQ
mmetsp:Transcript_18364/g.44344  ORF Transcript_18364/g.44344 Transcript_18364/m.44344 type:complete len:309 (-) Transcript_18364:361-1287(-)